jgi:hypothetical protein
MLAGGEMAPLPSSDPFRWAPFGSRLFTPLGETDKDMKTYLILLRGLTPSGKNKVLMAPLRAALVKAGLKDVQTYIQSGNVIPASNDGRASTIASSEGQKTAFAERNAILFRAKGVHE